MDLIKKFMKIGGFKTPDELEAYGEDRFFNDFPEARQYARGGLIKAQPGLWFQDPNKQALYDAETRYLEANQRGPNNNPDAAKAYGDILMMDPSATDIRQKVDSLNNVYPYYSSSFQVVPFKGGYGKYGNRTNQGWEATQELYDKEKQKPSIIPMDFSEPKWKGTVKQAYGGTPEAYPQIATFDKAFSYGVKPGPQYLADGGSAYPMAQTEAQFFVPVYTDVYNPYNKAMGGSNVEMYPNAKTTPHWGPTNVWFQEGGQEGAMQENQDLDRLGALNKTGAFVNNLKQTANKANAKNAMMNAINNVGMAKYGKQLSKYDPGGATAVNSASTSNNQVSALTPEELALAQQFKINDPGFDPAGTRLKIKQLQREGWIDEQMSKPGSGGLISDPAQRGAPFQQNQPYFVPGQPFYPYMYPGTVVDHFPTGSSGYPVYPHSNYGPQGDMRQFLNDYFVYTNNRPYAGSTTKGRVSVDGQRAGKFYGNMPLIKAMFPELYGKGNFADLMANNADFRNRAEAFGLTNYKEPTGLKKLWGSREYTFNQRVPWEAPTVTLDPKQKAPDNTPMDLTRKNQPGPVATPSSDPIPFTLEDANAQLQQNDPRAKAIMDNLQRELNPSNKQSSTSVSQPPSNANSSDAATAQKKASMIDTPVNQAYIDAVNSISPDNIYNPGYDTEFGYPTSDSILSADVPYNDNSTVVGQPSVNTMPASQAAPSQSTYPTGAPYKTVVGPLAEPSSGMDYTEPVSPYESAMARSIPPGPRVYPTGAPERVPVGPVVGPEGFAYGGYTGYRYGGSYKKGDVVYMSDDEIAEFIRNGGQIEEMD